MTDVGHEALGKARSAFALYRDARSAASAARYLEIWFEQCEIALEDHRSVEAIRDNAGRA